MPPDNNEREPKGAYLQAPGETPHRWSYEEVPDTEEALWSKDNPYLHLSPDAQQALTELGRACVQAVEAITKAVSAAAAAVGAIAPCVDFTQHLTDSVVLAALNMAPPRVRHLAEHGKKYRTRKKNMHRAMRAYKRRR